MIPKRGPIPNRKYLIGTFYDWVHGGHAVSGTSTGYRLTELKSMPINQVNKKANGRWLPGGDWLSIKTRVILNNGEDFTVIRPGYGKAYVGQFTQLYNGDLAIYADTYAGYVADVNYQKQLMDQLKPWAAEGFARARPDAPLFQIANSLWELREVPKQLQQNLYELLFAMSGKLGVSIGDLLKNNPKRLNIRQKALRRTRYWRKFGRRGIVSRSSENLLAIELGWIPLLSDIRNFSWALKNLDKRVKGLLKTAGTPVKRVRDLRESSVSRVKSFTNHGTPWNPNIAQVFVTQCYGDGDATTLVEEIITDYIYFVGKFVFTLPKGVKTRKGIKDLGFKLMGVDLSPTTVWNIVPWTWLADYFYDFNGLIESVLPTSVTESCNVKWGYVCRVKTVTLRRTCTSYIMNEKGKSQKVTSVVEMSHVIKSRLRVHPFGLPAGKSLTFRQAAIMAALPTSRTKW